MAAKAARRCAASTALSPAPLSAAHARDAAAQRAPARDTRGKARVSARPKTRCRATALPAASLATVFASSDADLAIIHRICLALTATPRLISPTDFHNSVHNAAAGYWSIAAGARAASTTISAHDGSFAAGLARSLFAGAGRWLRCVAGRFRSAGARTAACQASRSRIRPPPRWCSRGNPPRARWPR